MTQRVELASRRTDGRRLPSLVVRPPHSGDDWVVLTGEVLAIAQAHEWCGRPDCGAVVLFSGTVRDHAVDEQGAVRRGVGHLTYEAYEAHVVPRLREIAAELRRRWPATGRTVLWHRVGRVELGESSVVVAVSAPHRGEAFEAARYAIDAVKASAPIWKHEEWDSGADWGTRATPPVGAAQVTSPHSSRSMVG